MANNINNIASVSMEADLNVDIDAEANTIIQPQSNILTGECTLELCDYIPSFPVSMSCVNDDEHQSINDKKMDMNFWVCKETGIIQIKPIPSLEDIYIDAHNTSYGKVWNDLFDLFVNSLGKYLLHQSQCQVRKINIVEIGGGSLLLASKIFNRYDDIINSYTVYEKNISTKYIEDKRINVINEYFSENTLITEAPDLIIHSHVLEHVWNPIAFIQSIAKICNASTLHCFIAPNLQITFNKMYTNALNFEHNFYIIEPYIDTILHNNNFKTIEKVEYIDHSLLYFTQLRAITNIPIRIQFPNLYEQNKRSVMNFFMYHRDLVKSLNERISTINVNVPIYLFGAHIFSQYLLCFGLNCSRIRCVLDNSPQKCGKRLYGTNMIVNNPNVIRNDDKCVVILKAASYQSEIAYQLISINSNVQII